MSVTYMVLIGSDPNQRASGLVPRRPREQLLYSREELPVFRAPGTRPAGYDGAPQRIVGIENEESVPVEDPPVRHPSTPAPPALCFAIAAADSVPLGGRTVSRLHYVRPEPLRPSPRSPNGRPGTPLCSRVAALRCSSPY